MTAPGSMEGLLVRPIAPADESAWLEMRGQLWPTSRSDHAGQIARFFSGESREPLAVFMATDAKSRAVGFAELSIRPYAEGCRTDHVAFLEGWFVVPEARRRGAGRALIDACESWARSQGCSEFASDTEVDNDASIAAHLALDFVDEGVVRCFSKKL